MHRWYRFVLAFPPHLVRDTLSQMALAPGATVLDPFCGTGTTVVEAKKAGFEAIGIEASPMAHFASAVKTDWGLEPDALAGHGRSVLDALGGPATGQDTLDPDAQRLLLAGSISPRPLSRALRLLAAIDGAADLRFARHERLALARILPSGAGNLRFGPEVGVSATKKADAPVEDLWLAALDETAADLASVGSSLPATVHLGDSRTALGRLDPGSVHAVVTSPPYPNEKDYTRTTRLESVVLGFLTSRAELQAVKRTLVRSNTRTVYRGDDDDRWVADHPEVQALAAEIEGRRVALGKTSGFERLYHRVTLLYFGGMARHLEALKPALAPGARLAYVVGDQASYLRVLIRTGALLADLALRLGYEVEGVDLFRTRPATVTGDLLREEVVRLVWRP